MTVTFRSTLFAGLGALMLITPAIAEAGPRGCAPHDRHCGAPGKPQANGAHRPGPMFHPGHRPPPPAYNKGPGRPHPVHIVHPGHSAAKGRPFHRGKHSRFRAPPRGQEYRVVNDHLVLADSRTLRIVAVLGLMNELLR